MFKNNNKNFFCIVRNTLLLFCFAVTFSAPSWSGDLQSGYNAWQNKDYKTAFETFSELAEGGDPRAMFFLAAMYTQGQYVSKDEALANQWMIKSAESGNRDAQHVLGIQYDKGVDGFPLDRSLALKWYAAAADQGDVTKLGRMAEIYLNGDGVPQDYALAAKWYKQLVNTGSPKEPDLYNLAQLYSKGLGVPKDLSCAYMLYKNILLNEMNGLMELKNKDIADKARTELATISDSLAGSQEFFRAEDMFKESVGSGLYVNNCAQ